MEVVAVIVLLVVQMQSTGGRSLSLHGRRPRLY
jgi:hypothetical protein